ncbi:MAG: NINE protein [Lewinellaceae bacterium]|nr:NINE protein [Lewinellaceae bacterium]
MKDKNVAGILALFLGGFGVHRFYLGQTGLGIFYLIFCWFPVMWIIGLIDAIAFFSMDKENFDRKYNRQFLSAEKRSDTDFDRRNYQRRERWDNRQARREDRQERRYDSRKQEAPRPSRPPARPRQNPFKASGIKKYKDYDYNGAIEDFNKALDIEPNDVATHFNLACAYSLNENVEKAFYHLDRAVVNGFNDFQKIKEHDAFAYLRIQDGFEAFEKNGFRLSPKAEMPPANEAFAVNPPEEEDVLEGQPDLLEQLRRLGELREKGLLTEEEFAMQKKKLLG